MATLEVEIRPRKAFRAFLLSTTRWACLVCHRRAGKTVACVQKLIKCALEFTGKDGRFAYIAPTYSQAKDVAWSYLKEFTAGIPNVEVRESDLSIIFQSGARIRLYGSDNYDRMRGIYLDGVVIDEAADHDPRAWPEVIRPALSDRRGWATFIGTSKGKNAFYRIYESAKASDDWYVLRLLASESGILDAQELADARATLSEEQYEQEFECSFDAAITGAYFARYLREAERKGRICRLSEDPLMQIRAFWDIGGTGNKADAVAIWVVQFVGREIRVLDYYEAVGQPLAAHVQWLRGNGYEKVHCVLPHDGANNEKVYDISFESELKRAGFSVEVVPNQGAGAAMKRVTAARALFPSIWFNEATTRSGREALAWYHEKREARRDIGLGPNHDWSSHASDAFGMMCMVYQPPTGGLKKLRGPKISIA